MSVVSFCVFLITDFFDIMKPFNHSNSPLEKGRGRESGSAEEEYDLLLGLCGMSTDTQDILNAAVDLADEEEEEEAISHVSYEGMLSL